MLDSNVDLFEIKKFFYWWKKELSFLVPESIKKLFNDKTGFLIIQIKDEMIDFYYLKDDETQKLASLENNDTGLSDYETLKLNNPNIETASIILRLNKEDAITKTLVLPKAVEENLAQVIAYELDKYTPFNQSQVYYAIKKIANDSEKIKIELILAPKERLDFAYETLKEWNITPLLVDCEATENNLEDYFESYNLLPEVKRYKKDKKAILLQTSLIVSVFILFSLIIALPFWFQHQSIEMLESQKKKAKKDVMEVSAIQRKIDDVTEKTTWIINRKKDQPHVIEILNTVSERLKDDTWLKKVKYGNKKLIMEGESSTTSNLVDTLEDSKLFSSVTSSGVKKISKTEKYRFKITLNVNSNLENEATVK